MAETPTIRNPILPGFNPDPCICRRGKDYYIATSTFEWFPGVQIHHSRDLVNWRLLGRALDRVSQLDMTGIAPSCGIWAPALYCAHGLFWLIYTNVKSFGGLIFDTPNYLVTAEDPAGPWSDPVFLNATGFDPSIFHDDDGRTYILNMYQGEPGVGTKFEGHMLQEYNRETRKMVGEPNVVWKGTELGATEGPHLMKKDGWYYLLAAEGGTGVNHAISVARSRNLRGPYETHPDNPLITAAHRGDAELYAAGHGNLVQTAEGQWYLVHLCNRALLRRDAAPTPLGDDNSAFLKTVTSPLGRETAIQLVDWPENGWPRLAGGDKIPQVLVPAPRCAETPKPDAWDTHDTFDGPTWDIHFQTLRQPAEEDWISLSRRPGWLSLRGRESLYSFFNQSLLARRLQHFTAETVTKMDFRPTTVRQSAGLIVYTDGTCYKYFRMNGTDEPGKVKLEIADAYEGRDETLRVITLPLIDQPEAICLRAVIDMQDLAFSYSLDGETWIEVEETCSMKELGNWVRNDSPFTGTFVGMCCQDTGDYSAWAHFDEFRYRAG